MTKSKSLLNHSKAKKLQQDFKQNGLSFSYFLNRFIANNPTAYSKDYVKAYLIADLQMIQLDLEVHKALMNEGLTASMYIDSFLNDARVINMYKLACEI
jgi:hypothetical protein